MTSNLTAREFAVLAVARGPRPCLVRLDGQGFQQRVDGGLACRFACGGGRDDGRSAGIRDWVKPPSTGSKLIVTSVPKG
ncbi:hypothetical protein [Solirubrobacter soli]|uniref:hypothetical protein n=1 Tax=Solirubrobacter soli TaxID=363832 RepID=UPI000401A851|nr:hypothetical protein [Solirubrobacter soli]